VSATSRLNYILTNLKKTSNTELPFNGSEGEEERFTTLRLKKTASLARGRPAVDLDRVPCGTLTASIIAD
jgi:hypothetical protein